MNSRKTERALSRRASTSSFGVRRLGFASFALLALSVWLCAATGPAPFRSYPGWEYYDFPLPTDWKQPGEWVFARLMYPSVRFSQSV
jgi:hypothetical protein